MTHATYPALAHILWPAQNRSGRAVGGRAPLAVGGAALLAASAKVQVPFYPVPQTLQTMIVLLLGAAFGARLGAATVALYLAAGAAGLPVFAGSPEKGIGIAYMLGPTGGYLAGFVVARRGVRRARRARLGRKAVESRGGNVHRQFADLRLRAFVARRDHRLGQADFISRFVSVFARRRDKNRLRRRRFASRRARRPQAITRLFSGAALSNPPLQNCARGGGKTYARSPYPVMCAGSRSCVPYINCRETSSRYLLAGGVRPIASATSRM